MNETPVPAQKLAPVAPTNVTLDGFCVALSAREKRSHHMIGAFHHSQRLAKNLFDSAANYQSLYDKFCNQPA
jgi:hypothetical protein